MSSLGGPGGKTPGLPEGPWVVIGGDGLFGTALAARATAAGHAVLRTSRRPTGADNLRLDLGDDPEHWALPDAPAVGLLCAAVTSWERCRDEPAKTYLVNVERTVRLACLMVRRGAHVVFPSSNQVFDGSRPFRTDDDTTCPQTEYGRQKAAAEAELRGLGGVTVVRFGKVLGTGPGWMRGWGEALLRGEPIAPFADMVVSPVPLGFASEVMIRAGVVRPRGVLQVTGEQDVTYAEIAFRLADRLGADRQLIRPVSFADRGLPPGMAPRHTTLTVGRLRSELGLTPPPVWDTIDAVIRETFRGS